MNIYRVWVLLTDGRRLGYTVTMTTPDLFRLENEFIAMAESAGGPISDYGIIAEPDETYAVDDILDSIRRQAAG
jgi:hypothetical protein